MAVTLERNGDQALIRFANPPLNTLTDTVRAELAQALDAAANDPDVRAIVLASDGARFCTGLDHGGGAPGLMALCDRIEKCPKPVIVALQGAVVGDGLDLALACHYRVGARDIKIGAPGIRLGLPPHGGATQRLPRLCGAGPALALFLSGTLRPPVAGFLDAPLADDPVAAAQALAKDVTAPRPTTERREGMADPTAFMAAVAKARAGAQDAPVETGARIVSCVEGAMLLPLETGLAMEQAAFDDCLASPAATALRHLAGAESAAWQMPQAAGGRAQPMTRVALLGGTSRAGELAVSCLDAGFEVLLVELENAGQAIVLERILALYDDAVDRGTLTEQDRDARLLHIQPEATFDDLSGADVVWEAAVDDPVLRQELWAAITLLARPGALLIASGDTLLPVDLAGDGERLGDMVGLHIPGAAHLGPLAEIAPAPGATADTVASALALVRRLQRQAVRAVERRGGLLHHLSETLERTIEALLVAGHTAEDIDEALTDYGFRQAPCAMLDIRGLDHVLAHRRAVKGDDAPEIALLDVLIESGLTGRGAGAGLLLWHDGVPMGEPKDTRALITALGDAGVARAAAMPQGDIAHICAAVLADAGAKLFDAGLVDRVGDVDVAAVHGLGFPRWRGGPMAAADRRGLVRVEREITLAGGPDAPSPSFSHCIKNGVQLTSLKR